MGSLLHLFDFNQAGMDKKVFTHKGYTDDLETLRNSLKLRRDTSHSCHAVGEVQYSYQLGEEHSNQDCYPDEAKMKKLIDKEMSKHSNSRKNAPNIVARLMGMEILPSDMKPETQLREKQNEGNLLSKERIARCSDVPILSQLHSSMHMDLLSSSNHNWDKESYRWNKNRKIGTPRRREHPQEEELQKFKKEFEAYQAARIRECSKVLELGSINRQLLAQEDLDKVKMAVTTKSRRLASQKPLEPMNSTLQVRSFGQSDLQIHGNKMDLSPIETKKSYLMRNKSNHVNTERPFLTSFDQKMISSSPSRIVILKPGPDRICHLKEIGVSSSGNLGERNNMQDFLEEVKEQLKRELHGRTNQKVSGIRGGGIETPYSEKPFVPKHSAKDLAKHAREHGNKEFDINLIESESTRSCRSGIQLNGLDSPEFLDRNTLKLLSARQRNKKDAITNSGNLRLAVSDDENLVKEVEDTVRGGRETSYTEIERHEEEMQMRSFRHGADKSEVVHRELSPRNLVRSFSAPVSGSSFGKLLLEDRNIFTGAHIWRKHEANSNVLTNMEIPPKEKFNLKEKVSSFRYSFNLRRKLFGRKTLSMVESLKTEVNPVKDIMNGPTVLMNFRERQTKENSTEVPPSPASVCSSSIADDLWGLAEHISPSPTSELSPGDDIVVSQVFREINSNLSELRRQLHNLASDEFDDRIEHQPVESAIARLDDHAEAYIKELLIASGLYDGSADKFSSRRDMFPKPISNAVFEEVERTYGNSVKERKDYLNDQNELVDHKLLLDLSNEALSTILGPSYKISSFREFSNMPKAPPLLGKKLLDSVWEVIRVYIYPPTTRLSYYSLDAMVGRDVNSTCWPALLNDESNIIGRDIECLIMRDLVEEFMKDIQSRCQSIMKIFRYIFWCVNDVLLHIVKMGNRAVMTRIPKPD